MRAAASTASPTSGRRAQPPFRTRSRMPRRPRARRRAHRSPTGSGGSTSAPATTRATGVLPSIWARSRSTRLRPRIRRCRALTTPWRRGRVMQRSTSRGRAHRTLPAASTASPTSGRRARRRCRTRSRKERRPRPGRRARRSQTGTGGSTSARATMPATGARPFTWVRSTWTRPRPATRR